MSDDFERFRDVMETALTPRPMPDTPGAYLRTWTPPGAAEWHQRLRDDLGLSDDQEAVIDVTPLLGDRVSPPKP